MHGFSTLSFGKTIPFVLSVIRSLRLYDHDNGQGVCSLLKTFCEWMIRIYVQAYLWLWGNVLHC